MPRTILTGLQLIFFIVAGYGQSEKSNMHPIDLKREQCHSIASKQTTFGMIECEAIAKEEWENEMNKYYKLLMNNLAKDEIAKIKLAQKQWLDYRDKELDFSKALYYNMQGTMWRVVAASRSCDIVKQRALELKDYYGELSIKEGEE